MSVNLSGKQLTQTDVAEQVQDVLFRTNLDPRHLKLEITESVVMENAEAAARVLARLRALGVGLSIDDFGTGYSSLSYLHRFPVNTLKVDRSFVSRMTSGDENLEIVRTIVTLARNLGMDVVAEGIETGEQLAQLKALKCDYGQGYFFAKPLDVAAAEDLLLARDLNPSQRPASADQPDSTVATLRSPLVM
jgi:EAL domain-containing protein (putative c-di-GMP-specific phosphodiesterase class I)